MLQFIAEETVCPLLSVGIVPEFFWIRSYPTYHSILSYHFKVKVYSTFSFLQIFVRPVNIALHSEVLLGISLEPMQHVELQLDVAALVREVFHVALA